MTYTILQLKVKEQSEAVSKAKKGGIARRGGVKKAFRGVWCHFKWWNASS